MIPNQAALASVPSIYDSAVVPDTWGDTLEKSASALGAKGALLLIMDQHIGTHYQINHFSKIWSRAPERVAMYNEKFAQYEKPVWQKLFTMRNQQLVLDTDFWADEPDLHNRPDYQYLRENVGILRKCAARLNANQSWWDIVAFHFDESLPQIPGTAIDGINLLLPHIAKSVELARAFQQLKTEYNAVLAALDHVEVGMCITTHVGDIVTCNAEANRILEQDDGIRLSHGRLLFNDSDHQARFNRAVQETSATARGEQLTHEIMLTSETRSGKDPILVEISPLRDYENELSGRLTGSLITLVDPSNTQPFNVDRVAIAYQLSQAETEVCKYLLHGHTNVSMADIRGVSTETIKTQVKSVLQKTRCARRSDLIRLVLKATPPIVQRPCTD